MSRTYHHGERRIMVRGVRREQPDLRRVARAIVELAAMRAEAQAEAEHHTKHAQSKPAKRCREHGQQTPQPRPEAESGA